MLPEFKFMFFQAPDYLGRLFIKSKRHFVDMSEMTGAEAKELMEILRETRSALSKSFKPDLFNYASLGNEVSHFHMHVIPRYKRAVSFDKTEFLDGNWGTQPYPYNLNFQVESSTLEKIRKTIADNLRAV